MIKAEPFRLKHTRFFSNDDFTKEKNLDNNGSLSLINYKLFPSLLEPKTNLNLQKNEFEVSERTISSTIFDPKNMKVIEHTQKKPNFRILCNNTAQKLGFNLSSKGTLFIIDAVIYLFENDICRFQMGFIYELLSKKYNIKIDKVKWNIDNSIKSMRRYSNEKILKSVFSEYDGRSPNAKYIIILFVYELRKHYKTDFSSEENERILYCI